MNRPPAFSFYVRDWFVDTADLDVAEEGAYIRLLAYSWVKPLPSEPAKLARIVRVNPRRWNKIWCSISGFFGKGNDGSLVNARLEDERRKSQEFSSLQSKKGKASGNVRRNRGSTPVEPKHEPKSNLASASATATANREQQQQLPVAFAPTHEEEFKPCWMAYPKRAGSNSRADALQAFTRRRKEGVTAEEMLAGTRRYAGFVADTGKIGTEFVMQAVRFYGPSKHYTESWELSAEASRLTPKQREEQASLAWVEQREKEKSDGN